MKKNSNSSPLFSIIIPTLNEEKYLPALLTDLSHQTRTDFEVIVVDGTSTDQTLPAAQKFSQLNLKIITTATRNVSYQRNLGGQQATGSWLIFMDADNQLPPYFLQGIKYRLDQQPDLNLFSCWLDVASYQLTDQPIAQIINLGLEILAKVDPAALGAMIGVQAPVFNQIQFNPQIKFSEDQQFVNDVVKAGFTYRCLHDPRYHYSFRRLKKEGSLKIGAIFAESTWRGLIKEGGGHELAAKWPMLGGSYYQVPNLTLFQQLNNFFRQASRTQLNRVKKVWQIIVNEFEN